MRNGKKQLAKKDNNRCWIARDLFWAAAGAKKASVYKYESALVNCEQSKECSSRQRERREGEKRGKSKVERSLARNLLLRLQEPLYSREMKIRHAGVARGAAAVQFALRRFTLSRPPAANIQAIFFITLSRERKKPPRPFIFIPNRNSTCRAFPYYILYIYYLSWSLLLFWCVWAAIISMFLNNCHICKMINSYIVRIYAHDDRVKIQL